MRLFRIKRRWFLLSLCVIAVIAACQAAPGRRTQQATQHNAIIFVADGLRPTSINPTDTPALNEIRERGVKFSTLSLSVSYLHHRQCICDRYRSLSR